MPTQPHAVMRPAAPESGRRANNATGVIRRCAGVSWWITASGYSLYAALKPTQPHAVMRPAAPESGRHDLAKVGVASSSLVSRSKFYNLASAGLVKVRRQRFGFGRTGNKL